MTRLQVATAQPYEVVVEPGAHRELPAVLASLGEDVRRVAIIHTPAVRERAEDLRAYVQSAGLERPLDIHLIEVPDGEPAKQADVLTYCWGVLGEAGFTRSDVVVGLGGGATTDLAGFVAASWLRGVRFVNLPTTVLGMVDAAVGGKTGINTASGKNLVGAFHEPVAVLCDLHMLQGLPRRELRSGVAEIVKCGFIAAPSILELIESAGPSSVLDPTSSILAELIAQGIGVKARTVAGDLHETGADGTIGREALNYGHTLGHAIERVQQYSVRHGEAISVGMVFVAELAHRLGRIDADLLAQHRWVLRNLGLPTTYTGAFEPALAAMRIDKKSRGDVLRFVVLDGLARPGICTGPDEQVLAASFEALRP